MDDSEVYSFALKNALNEIRNICPEIKNSFMFREDGEIIAGDESTSEKEILRVIDSFDGILEKAEAIGGIDNVILESSKGRVNISCSNDLYIVTVTSREADMNYVNTVTRVLIPTILRLIDKIHPTPLQSNLPLRENQKNDETALSAKEPVEETMIEEPKETTELETKLELSPPESSAKQFIVENLGGLLVPSDTVRIDDETISEWEMTHEGEKIEEVEIETFDGKITRCKIKPIKDSKYHGKGIIQMPEKVQLTLEIRKGELVRVKPIIE